MAKKKGMSDVSIDWEGTLFGEVGLVKSADATEEKTEKPKTAKPAAKRTRAAKKPAPEASGQLVLELDVPALFDEAQMPVPAASETPEPAPQAAPETPEPEAVEAPAEAEAADEADEADAAVLEPEATEAPEEIPAEEAEAESAESAEPADAEEGDAAASADAAGDGDVEAAETSETSEEESEGEEGDEGDEEEEEAEGAVPRVMTDVMSADVEEDGALTLARYASKAYLEYAMSVVKARALPEVSDGQKPVQRRILLDMLRMGLMGAKAVKSARVVGDVLGKYHPHGDKPVYDAMVRMAQDFSLRYPLVVGEGNFGSRDGDKQAAMRYTEARLNPIAELLLDELDQGAVSFVPNYDGNFEEPVELPAKLPFVLLNGASGIAVGMATEIPPHNLTEVAAACELLIEKPEATLEDVLDVMPAPDFPCGGQIISSRSEIRSIYRTGRGKLRVRARWHFEELSRGQWQLVVDELPPATSSRDVLDRIEQITNPKIKKGKKTLSAAQIHDKSSMLALLDRVRDESGKDVAVRLVFEPKSARVDRQEFVTTLLAQTDLESNVPVNLVMIGIDKKPQQKGLLDILREWITFRTETVRRRSRTRLEKVLDRIHVYEGRRIVFLNLDRVIEVIRNSEEPKPDLMREFALTERQADDILEMRLRQLAKLEALAIERELEKLNKERASLERLLANEGVLRRQVITEIRAAAKKFGDARRTLVEAADAVAPSEKKVADEPVTVVVSEKGFLRSRTGHGHDCSLMSFKPGDGFLQQFECRSVDTLTVLDDRGRIYAIPVANLPGGRGDGSPLSAFIEMERGAQPVAFVMGQPDQTVIFITSDGFGVACHIKDLATRVRAGRTFIKLNPGKTLLPPVVVDPDRPLLGCLSAKGRFLAFPAEEVRLVASGGKGVTLMSLETGDRLVSACGLDDKGCRISGTGRGGKAREAAYGRKAFPAMIGRRGRRGKVLALTWRAEKVEAVPRDASEPTGEPPVENGVLELVITDGDAPVTIPGSDE